MMLMNFNTQHEWVLLKYIAYIVLIVVVNHPLLLLTKKTLTEFQNIYE